jgi:glucose uptake protein
MTLPETYLATLLWMLAGMLCLGLWANTFKLAGTWRFELYYFDYAFGVLLAAGVYGLTAGSLGFDGFSLVDDLMQTGKRHWAYCFAGGAVFNLGHMLLVGAMAAAGMTVAFPVGIGLAVAVGVGLHYILTPNGAPILLFAGCAAILAAAGAGALAHRSLAIVRHEAEAKAGRAKSTRRRANLKGVYLALAGGVPMGCSYPLLAMGQGGEAGMGPYAAGLVFALGLFTSTFLFNLFFMNLPVEGQPVDLVDYFRGKLRQHALGILGGAIWASGAIACLAAAAAAKEAQAGAAAGYAAGPGAAVVSALCGLLVWKEFAGADIRTRAFTAVMLALFVCGLTMLSAVPLLSR